MKLYAYAKVNLCLSVLPKTNSKSKHYIDSIFCLYKKQKDIIYIKKAKKLNIKYLNCSINNNDCIILKSLKYLQQKFGWDINYYIKIWKNIFPGTGLGGASSDAAIVINYLLKKHPNTALDLEDIALCLGSDIPYFLSGYNYARVKQYGNFVSPIFDLKAKFKVLTNKCFISTKDVFNKLDQNKQYRSLVDVNDIFNCVFNKQPLETKTINDLTPYILETHQELKNIYKKTINEFSKKNYVFFTGSGSSMILLKK